jgi:hypothetical protein
MRSDPEPTTCYATSMSDQNDSNLINFIATTVEALRERVDAISEQMATKVDLARVESNLRAEMATKDDLARVESNLRAEMATKDDLARVESNLRAEMATKDDLANLRAEMATKDDLANLRAEMATKDDLARLKTTMHGEFEQVHIRFDSMDRRVDTRMGQIETDVSRLRSVVYLLVKDKPDMLRLLGQPNRGEVGPAS